MASQKVKGIAIQLGAETTAINSALQNLNKTIGSTQKELTQVDKLLKLDPKNVNLLTQKQSLLSKAIGDTTLKLEELTKAKELADKDDKVDKNSKSYKDLAIQIEATKIKLSQYENQQEATNKALDEGSKNALDFGDILKANLLSDAIISGAKALGQAFIDIGKSIYGGIRDSGRLADDINTLANQYNLSTKEIQQFMKASDLVDVELSTITKSFTKLTKNMTSTSKDVQNAFKTLGIQVKDNNGELRSSNDVFYETIDALSKVANETEQDNLALQIFGKSAADLGSLINGGTEQLAEFNKYLEENDLLLSESELNSLNDMNDSFDVLTQTIDSIKNKIASELAPVIQPIVDDIVTYILENKDSLIQLVTDIVNNLTSEDMKDIFDQIKDTIKKVVDFMINSVPSLIQDIKDVATALQPVLSILNAIVDAIKYIDEHSTDMYGGYSSYADMRRAGRGGGSLGFGSLQSGGFASGGITLNNTFTISNGNNIDESVVRNWAKVMANQINEELGQMV